MLSNRYEGIEDEMLILCVDTGRNLPLGDRNREMAMKGWGEDTDDWVGRPMAVCAVPLRERPDGDNGDSGRQRSARRQDQRGSSGGRFWKQLVTDPAKVRALFVDVLTTLVSQGDDSEHTFCEALSASLERPIHAFRDIPPDAYSVALRLATQGEIPSVDLRDGSGEGQEPLR